MIFHYQKLRDGCSAITFARVLSLSPTAFRMSLLGVRYVGVYVEKDDCQFEC